MSDSEIAQLHFVVDDHFYDTLYSGITFEDENALMAKLRKGKEKMVEGVEKKEVKVSRKTKKEAAEDLKTIRGIITYKLTAAVGKKDGAEEGSINKPEDVKQVAFQLKEKGKTVSKDSLEKGTVDDVLITAIGEFQKEINKDIKDYVPDCLIDPGFETYKKLFDVKDYKSGLESMYGISTNVLNKKLEKGDSKLSKLDRDLTYDSKTKKNIGSFDESKNITSEEYDKSLSKIEEKIGVEKDSNEAKMLTIVNKAISSQEYFNELTKDVTSELNLSKKSLGSNSVNTILEHRLNRYHKVMVALGLFSGNMNGGACRDEVTAHCWSIYYYWKTGNAHINTFKENLVKMYNKELKPDGKECVDKDGNVSDLDGNVWAKKEHFNFDKEGKACDLNSTWDDYMEIISQVRVDKKKDETIIKDWRLESAAEGYVYGDEKRFPMPLSSGMPRSKHITGDAIDINYGSFLKMNDAINDLIALRFGLIRPVSGEQWHFEITNVEFSKDEKKLIN